MTKKLRRSDFLLCGVLFLLPFLHVNIGLNAADQGYNLINFESFPHMNQTWMIATLMANIVGKLLTFLPFGHYMLGMNIYCTLLLSIVSIVMFCILKKDYNKYAVFTGLLIAICFSWAPKVTLYQYLSYYLFCIASVLLVKGLTKKKRNMLFVAGIILGINLFVRFPNIMQVALILVVISSAIIYKRKVKECFLDILTCIAGYLIIVLPIILLLELILGWGSYADMVHSLFAMTDSATSYTPFAMFYSMYASYLENIKWFVWFVVEAVIATVIYGFLRKKWQKYSMYILMALAFLFILRVYWYWGIFNIHYTTYSSVYVWGVCFLMLSILVLLYAIFASKFSKEKRIYAMAGLIIVFITPLGSNNALYSNYNNLYFLAPVVIGTLTEIIISWNNTMKGKEKRQRMWNFSPIPLVLISYFLITILCLQTFMFHIFFVFGDAGITGDKKITVDANNILTGIVTTETNAEELSELTQYIVKEQLQGSECIVWSHSPMLFYAMDLECAVGHTWPMLDSYPYEEFVIDMEKMEECPIIIYEAQYYPDLLGEVNEFDAKTQIIYDFMIEENYKEVFRNDIYVVCIPESMQ